MLDQRRILARLKSRHAPKTQFSKGKPPLLPLLNRALQDLSRQSCDEAMSTDLNRIRLSSEQLCNKFASLEACEIKTLQLSSRVLLHAILMQISELDIEVLQTALGRSNFIGPSTRASLLLKVSKLGRYHRITCDLIDAARSSYGTLFRRISVQAIAKPNLNMAPITTEVAGFEQIFTRVTRLSQRTRNSTYDPKSASAVQKKFETRIADRCTRWKVHAEIQLVIFYEQYPSKMPPRIIGSSKSACYLCDLFIQHHGLFQVARSHGKLYDRWILPKEALDQSIHLQSVVEKFNTALETTTLEILNSKRKPFPHPAESVLIFRQPWSPNPTLSMIHSNESLRKITEHLSSKPSGCLIVNRSETSSSCSLSMLSASTERFHSTPNLLTDRQSSVVHTSNITKPNHYHSAPCSR